MAGMFPAEAVIFAAGCAAGLINAIAGGGTLVSFPTLVWLGRDPIVANATNTVALWPGSLASMVGFRREMQGAGRFIGMLAGPSLLGGLIGASLLLRTPSRTFAAVVPFLILGASALLAVQEPLVRGLGPAEAPRSRPFWAAAMLFQLGVGVYGGYFGAGIGILMLAALGLLGIADIHQRNGLKNLFAAGINGIAAAYFAASGTVRWGDAALTAAGAVVGGYAGARLARALGRDFVRRAAVLIGLAMGLSLLFRR